MNTLTKLALITLLSLSFFSCSKTTDVEQENAILAANVSIPSDKAFEIEILEEVNAYRITKGLTPFAKLNIIKSQTATHTEHMINTNTISHQNFSQRSDFLIQNANAKKVGENLAVGFDNCKQLVEAWVRSESHRKNIEGNYSHFDVSAEKNEEGTWYITNIFIRR